MSLLKFPQDLYHLREGEVPLYGEFPDLKKGVEWFVAQISKDKWVSRRDSIAKRFYKSLIGEFDDATGKGRFFEERDQFGWYLFLGESFNDHPWNYEVVFGCRVVPVLAAIGRNLPLLQKIEGFVERTKKIATTERGQPNGGLFEILVAAAYAREGWRVAFKGVQPGVTKTYDLDVEKNGRRYAVECKRMEGGTYVEAERARMRELWKVPGLMLAIKKQRSTHLDVKFKLEMKDVANDYLLGLARHYLRSGLASFTWDDTTAGGTIGDLDLSPIQASLEAGYLLHPGPVFDKLLTGSYRRYDNMITLLRLKHAACPHFVDEVDLAVTARWSSLSEAAIEKKARGIQSKLAEANRQLPANVPGVIHIGFEAISGDDVERRRYEKIINLAQDFDPEGSRLEFLYCHYFAPETTPEETWAIDETVHWIGTRKRRRPLRNARLVLPESEGPARKGVHWDGKSTGNPG